METKANYILIGLFTILVVAAGFGFVYWFSNTGTGAVREAYRVIFQGSVSGLRPGASVLFNGIRVGEVTALDFDRDDPKQVIATIAVNTDVPVKSDTRVGLDFQGLTGIASLTLKGGALNAPPLANRTLIADKNATQDMTAAVREVATSAQEVLGRVNGLLAENQQAIKTVVDNLQGFTGSLDRNKEMVDNLRVFTETLKRNSERLDTIVNNVENLTGEDTRKQILDAVASFNVLAKNLDKRVGEISVGLNRFSNTGLREFEQLAVDGRRTLAELDRAIRNLDRNPSRVLFGGNNGVPEYNGKR